MGRQSGNVDSARWHLRLQGDARTCAETDGAVRGREVRRRRTAATGPRCTIAADYGTEPQPVAQGHPARPPGEPWRIAPEYVVGGTRPRVARIPPMVGPKPGRAMGSTRRHGQTRARDLLRRSPVWGRSVRRCTPPSVPVDPPASPVLRSRTPRPHSRPVLSASAAAQARLRHGPAPLLRRRTTRPARTRPARCRDGAAGPGPVRGPGRERQDHDARGARRVAGRGGRRRPGDDRRDHIQHACRGGASGTARPGARAAQCPARRRPRSHVPRARPGDPPGHRRASAAPGSRRGPSAGPSRPRRGRAAPSRRRVLAPEAHPCGDGRGRRARPGAGAGCPGVPRLRRSACRGRRDRLRRPGGPRAPSPGSGPAVPEPLAVALRAPPGRRGPGRRREPAPPGAPAGGAREPHLPGRRRRPVDLRLAARRCASCPGFGGRAARAPARGP